MNYHPVKKIWQLLIFLLCSFEVIQAQSTKPNIILILVDDLGYQYLSHTGNLPYSTPNLDTMAQRGISFTQCHASPLCTPSRHMLLTGKYNFRNYFQFGQMSLENKTIGNMLMSAGYKTACYGKWQLENGDVAMKTFGFNNYCIFNPLDAGEVAAGSRYKDPHFYTNGAFIDDNLTKGKYGEDILTDSVIHFIDDNKSAPFFIYYPMPLVHFPFQPTPDDAAYSAWDINTSDTTYFRSMVKYMDKKIRLILDKVIQAGIQNNTYVIFTADNGTPVDISDKIDGKIRKGGKGKTTSSGTNVPLIVIGPGIQPGSSNNDLIDFTDFLPTLAGIAKIPKPNSFGPLDGLSFKNRLTGKPDSVRQTIFCYYKPFYNTTNVIRWAHDGKYKLYDSLGTYIFYDLKNDLYESSPLNQSALSSEQSAEKMKLLQTLYQYAAQSAPELRNTTVSEIGDTSAILGATITDVGGFSAVTERGTVFSLRKDMLKKRGLLLNFLPDENTSIETYTQLRKGFLPQTYYTLAGYAKKNNLTGFSPPSVFLTLSKSVVSESTDFYVIADTTTMKISWSKAIFPNSGATKVGYLLVYNTSTPTLIPMPNGHAPINIISNGKIIPTYSTRLPILPNTQVQLAKLIPRTEYELLLVPYTWDGKNDSSYNYFMQGAKRLKVKTLLSNYHIYPNPSNNAFNLSIETDTLEKVKIVVSDVVGKKIYYTEGDSFQKYSFGNEFPAGTYFVNVLKDKSNKVFKIIKTQK